jgi:alpha-beta hydrolase superfamily lysophospholipase
MKRIAVAAALAPMLLRAQEPEQASFYLLASGRDTIIAEREYRTATELHGEFVDRMRGARITYVASLNADATIGRLAVHSFRSASDTVGEIATFDMAGDTMVVRMGAGAPVRLASLAGALPIVNPSVAFIEQMVRRARGLGGTTVDVPVFLLGTQAPSHATVRFVGDSAVLSYASVTMQVAVSADGRVLGGRVPAQNLVIARGPGGLPLAVERRDYSAPADAPYTAEEVVVRTPAGLRLAGTLTVPKTRRGRVPAVVTITGSGSEDRDEGTPALRGYRPFRELADTLGRRGIAVLRLDDRGVGGSDLGPLTATSADFADDIRAGVAYLRTRGEIDSLRIGLVGHSEGGLIAPMVAESDRRIRALVLLAAPASTGRAILSSQQHFVVDTVAKLTGAKRDSALAQYRHNTDSLASTVPWLRWFLDYDPTIVARRVRTPVLILHGENDHQVPLSEARKLAAAFRAGGNTNVTVRTFPATNHLFVAGENRDFSYEKLPSLAVRPSVLGAIADWLTKTLR